MGTIKQIVILHGWTHTLDKWIDFTKLLQTEGFTPDLLTIPGLTEESHEVWTLDKYVDWLHHKLFQPVILLGHSNGGRIAIAFTAKYPELVSRLILIDSAGISHSELPLRMKRWVFGSMAKIGKRFTGSETLRKVLYLLAGEEDYQTASPSLRQTMVNMLEEDLTSSLKKIAVPTVLIWGKEDKLTPVSDGVAMSELITKSKLEIIPNARHAPFFTHPEEVITFIKNGI